MAGLYEGVEEIPFKKIDGGYVFQTNNPWFFGPKQRFLVTATQKGEIAACIRETMRRIKPFVFAAMVVIPLALAGGLFWLVQHGGSSRTSVFGGALLLSLALFLPYLGALHFYSTKRLKPLIAGLPRTDAKISLAENSSGFAAKASVKLLAIMAGAAGLGLTGNAIIVADGLLNHRSLASMGGSLFALAAGGLTTVFMAYIIVLRIKAKRSAF